MPTGLTERELFQGEEILDSRCEDSGLHMADLCTPGENQRAVKKK